VVVSSLSTYSVSGGTLKAEGLYIYGTLAVTAPGGHFQLSRFLSFEQTARFTAAPGAALYVVTGGFGHESTDPGAMTGLSNLTLVLEDHDGRLCYLEPAGADLGTDPLGWTDNFVLGTVKVGEADSGSIRLRDYHDNQNDGPDNEAVYVDWLVLNPGAKIDFNNLNLYFLNGGAPKQLFHGDANLDGRVDGLDYVAWSNHYEMTGMAWCDGDSTGDRAVDGLDYVLWSNNYLQGCPASPGAVPEPSSVVLLLAGLWGLSRRRAKRMTKANTFVLLVAVAALSVAAPLAQAASTQTLFQVDYGLGPSTNNGGLGRDSSITALPGEDHTNRGAATSNRIVKGWQHTYIADWDTAPMIADLGVGGQLTGWGPYTPNYYMAVKPRTGVSYWNDNGTPLDPGDDFVNPIPVSDWPDSSDPAIVNISSIWSTNDWFEGAGDGYQEYNWSAVVDYASTIWYAGDIIIPGMEIPWSFPGGGTGANAPYDPFPNCTFIETFHTLGDYAAYGSSGWSYWNGEPKTPTNSTAFILDNTAFFANDNGTPADDSDDYWDSVYVEVPLDQAMIDDMFTNVNNRGVALWDWDWEHWSNGEIYSSDDSAGNWPYIYARIEAREGDANLDGCVNGLDYVTWSNNYDLDPSTWAEGDYNLDGVTDGLDYVVWSSNYATCPPAPGVVPEPASALMLILGICALRRRRQ
jgi:hypothetical protein